MVTIKGYEKRISADDREFHVLLLEGQLTVQQSKNGASYACKSKCSIPFTGSEAEAEELLGFTLPGTIEKTPCESYEFTNPQSKEKVTLDYRYSYKSPEIPASGTTNPNLKLIEAEVH